VRIALGFILEYDLHRSLGTSAYCSDTLTTLGVTQHLQQCQIRHEVLQDAEPGNHLLETLWYLRIQDTYLKEF